QRPRSARRALRAQDAARPGRPRRGDPDVDPPARRRGADVRPDLADGQGQAGRRSPRRRSRQAVAGRAERRRGLLCLADRRRGADVAYSPAVTPRALIRWSELHERRARAAPAAAMPLVVGGVLAAWVGWRSTAGILAASHAWLAGTLVAYTVAF